MKISIFAATLGLLFVGTANAAAWQASTYPNQGFAMAGTLSTSNSTDGVFVYYPMTNCANRIVALTSTDPSLASKPAFNYPAGQIDIRIDKNQIIHVNNGVIVHTAASSNLGVKFSNMPTSFFSELKKGSRMIIFKKTAFYDIFSLSGASAALSTAAHSCKKLNAQLQ